MPELWLGKIFPGTVFVSTDLPEKRVHVTKSKQELEDLDDDSVINQGSQSSRRNSLDRVYSTLLFF